jgi:signal transduction histidine kinase
VHEAVEVVGIANLVLFVLAAIVAVRQWRANPGNRAGLWAALAFLALAFVVVFARVLPDDPDRLAEHLGERLDVAMLVLFPYLLYRFTTAFEPPTLRLERFLAVMTAVLLTATFSLPYYPNDDESRPWWFWVYLALFLVHWTILLVTVAVRLWRAGTGQPSVARRRMRTLALAAIVITAALFLAAAGADSDSWLALAVAAIATVSAVSFILGLAPPFLLRLVWRRPEQRQLQLAITGLMSATTPQEVAGQVLGPLAKMVGARRAAIYDTDGALIAEHETAPGVTGREITTVDFQAGRLVVQTTPFAPYFGDEERKLLASVASLTGIALDRVRLFAQERGAREALERADELKTQFVALAAHELRSPVTTIYGFAETIRRRGHEIPPAQRAELERQLYEQIDRLRELVEQLLDLSRLEANAVQIHPERLVIGKRLREIVAGAVPQNESDVRVDADPRLEASVDATALDRIVSNLLVNAFRYGRPPVVVRAGAAADAGLSIMVEDSGPGVAPEFVPQLFERFARGGSAQGTGLGLAIARSYARAHHGELVYRPVSPHGALFEVVLPAA